MRKYGILCAFTCAACLRGGSDVVLYVTDYNDPQKPDMPPLCERPLTYGGPREVIVVDREGKREVFRNPKRVTVRPRVPLDPQQVFLFAARGEYEPFSFLLRPKKTLPQVFIRASDLKSASGSLIPRSCIVIASVESFHGGGRRILVPLGKPWNMAAFSTEFFWYTVAVPRTAQPGTYRGTVTVVSGAEEAASLKVTLEVLPFSLPDPPYSLGLNYSYPGSEEVMVAHFKDMHRHGMTTVAPLYGFHLPIYDTDTSQMREALRAFRTVGFSGVMYLASTLSLHTSELAGFGPVTSRRWQQKYVEVMLRIHNEVRRHGVPVIMSVADELTNKGITGVKTAGLLARFVWEELPEIATTSDMNGYREVLAMAPYLNVAAFNNGWDGIDHHNEGRHLINREFVRTVVEKAGAIPWFVNGGVGRFPFGFFFWKAASWGVRGKVEWYYNLRNERGSLVRTDGAAVYPTLDYERCREGIDDLKYLVLLENVLREAEKAGKAEAACRRARAFLKKLSLSIADDWTAYQTGTAVFPDPQIRLTQKEDELRFGSFSGVRRACAEHCRALVSALGQPGLRRTHK